MISNNGPETNGQEFTPITQQLPPELVEMMARSCADGTSAAIAQFMKVNNVNCHPGTKSDNPILVFAMRLTAEFAADSTSEEHRKLAKLHPYPFKKSIKRKINEAVDKSKHVLFKLWCAGEKENIQKLCRIIGAGETIAFLEERRPMVLKMIAKIRGDDLVKLDPNSKIQ